jgi:hypothetical protein
MNKHIVRIFIFSNLIDLFTSQCELGNEHCDCDLDKNNISIMRCLRESDESQILDFGQLKYQNNISELWIRNKLYKNIIPCLQNNSKFTAMIPLVDISYNIIDALNSTNSFRGFSNLQKLYLKRNFFLFIIE